MSGKPVVFVIGASGTIGSATLCSLSSMHAKSLDIKAGVRDPTKAEALKALPGVTVVQATIGDTSKLESTLRGVDALLIVTPPNQERVAITLATAKTAKKVGVKHLVVVSGANAEHPESILGAQFFELEREVKQLGMPFTMFRLPMFVDNFYGAAAQIKSDSAFYFPFDSDKVFTAIVPKDAGKAAAAILADPAKHSGRMYNFASDRFNLATLAATFSSELGRPIKHVQLSYDDTRKGMLAMGIPGSLCDALFDYYKMIDKGAAYMNLADPHDIENITGQKPTTIQQWIHENRACFQ